uniref:coiled-coil domain-containing protein 38 n=1 Tax=Jaculus jaculus TaxID=51337 RepID=UPI001E1B0302|nr:coiled-coil domain-containing protein 38 [Jaculus jaculus]
MAPCVAAAQPAAPRKSGTRRRRKVGWPEAALPRPQGGAGRGGAGRGGPLAAAALRRRGCPSSVTATVTVPTSNKLNDHHRLLSVWVAFSDRGPDNVFKKDKPYRVFFKDLFLFKESEMAAKKRERIMNRSMKVYQKTTFSSRMKSRSHLGQLSIYAEPGGGSFENLGLDPTLILRLTEGADRKRSLHEFINDQRDRFLLEYAVLSKKNTIKRFEKDMATKEGQLKKAERKLQDDAVAFEEFLRENDQQSIDALKMAAQETLNKLQMTAELKKASMEMQAVRSEITKTEFLLREYMKYGFFLLKLSPKQWQTEQSLKRAQSAKSNAVLPKILERFSINVRKDNSDSDRASVSEDSPVEDRNQEKPKKKLTFKSPSTRQSFLNRSESTNSEDSLEFFLEDEQLDFDLEPEIYFKEPEELLQVFTELEEQNLILVQYSQDVDENLEDVNKREKVIQDKINNNIEFLLEHKQMLKANCEREEEKAAELELRSRLFSFGEFKSDDQEKLIDSLSNKINQVYRVCIGDAEVGSLNAVQKLVKVESRLVELSDLIETIPKESVDAIERIKQKERRQKLREEKMREKQKHQEERLKAALERAVSQPKKKLGRRLMYRSKPPSTSKQEILLVTETRTKSLEEEFFFG